jgi:hypothetical protein
MVGVVIWFLYGEVYAGPFLYGAGVGIVSSVSRALTVSLLSRRANAFRMMLGAVLFVGRYGFWAVTLGVPAYLDLWPALPMMLGCVGVYLAENVLLLPGVLMVRSRRSVGERVERRVEV